MLFAGLGWMLVAARDGRGGQEAWWSLLREFVLIPLALGLPLLVGLISGTALATERRNGVVCQLLSRGVTRSAWAFSRVLASALTAALTIGGLVAALALLISVVGPSGGTSEVFAAVPKGFPQGGALLAIAFGAVAATASVFWAIVFCFVGLLTTNLFPVISIPLLTSLVVNQAGDVFPGIGLERVMTLDRLAPGPVPASVMWMVGILLAVSSTLIIATRKETLD